jgi:hypothetical protein
LHVVVLCGNRFQVSGGKTVLRVLCTKTGNP